MNDTEMHDRLIRDTQARDTEARDTEARDTEAARKDAVLEFYRGALATGMLDPVNRLFAPAYVAHAPRFAGGLVQAAGREALLHRLQASTPLANEVVRIIEDGDRVFVHVRYPGTVPLAGCDIFQFDDSGRISAHWNVRQPLKAKTGSIEERFATSAELSPAPHGASNLDGSSTPDGGSTAPRDRAYLKRRVLDMLEKMWAAGNADLVPEYYSKAYVQHNPDMPGGYARIKHVVETDIRRFIEATGTAFPIEVHHIGAEGDIVFVHLSISMAGLNRNAGDQSTNVDIFRVDSSGLMVEHWDVLQMESEKLPDTRTIF